MNSPLRSDTFRDFIAQCGYTPPDAIQPGRFIRFPTNEKRGDDAGYARLFDDGEGGIVGDFRSGQQWVWQATRERPFSEVERRAWKERIQREAVAAQAEREQAADKAAERAKDIWSQCSPAPASHPYLAAKGIAPHTLRLYNGPLAVNQLACNGALVAPLFDSNGDLRAVEFVKLEGKRFLPGTTYKGCYFPIGKPAEVICIAEGLATAISVHEATGYAVCAAASRGNLAHVAQAMRSKFPNARLIVCADNDADTEGNPGKRDAMDAARGVGGLFAVPEMGGEKCDFNDLAKAQGAEAVKRAIEGATAPDGDQRQPERENAPEGVPEPLRRRIVALSIDELLTRDFPPMEPLLAPWLCKQHLSMVYAWRGVGKTHFALGVAYAVAGGGQFLKWKAEKPRRVVYIDGEMAGAAIKEWIAAIVESTPDDAEPPEGYFHIITPDAQEMPLPDLSSLEGQAALEPLIADAELVVVDNLSSLMRSGAENEGESWVPVAAWALELRRQGKAVLFVHHAGKSNTQRGSSRREDLMDVVIKLSHAKDYQPEMGAAFTVEFEKARHLNGDDARNLEAALIKDEQGRQQWTVKDGEMGMSERILALHAEAPDMSQTEIAAELGCNRSTVSRAFKGAKMQSAGGLQ